MKYLIINVEAVEHVPQEDVFQLALKKCVDGEIIGSVNADRYAIDDLRAEIVGMVNGQDVTPVLLYEDDGWAEDFRPAYPDLVIIGGIAALATGNIPGVIDYCRLVDKRNCQYWIMTTLKGKRIQTDKQPLPVIGLSPLFLRKK